MGYDSKKEIGDTMLSYEGIFFEGETVDFIHSLETEKLPLVNDEIHCTFKYHPIDNEIFNELVGKEIEVLLVGYGHDGKNSGFKLELPEDIMEYYINYDEENPQVLKVPHITASLSEGAKASKTKNLSFVPLDKPIPIKGKFGYWIKEEDKEYVSYEPYNKEKVAHR